MNTVAKTSSASLAIAALGGLKQGLQNVHSAIPQAGGEPILRMGKDGVWVYGAENTEVEKGSEWAANPFSLMHGWINWKQVPQGSKEKPEKFGEILVPMTEPKPAFSSLPVYEGGEWAEQTSITFRCLSGDDEGTQSDYKPSSVGGSNAMKELIAAVMDQLDKDPAHPVPVVVFGSAHYQHKTWGKTYVPDIKIVDWVSLDDVTDAAGDADGEPPFEADEPKETTQAQAPTQTQAAPAEGRRRRATAAPETQAAAPADDDSEDDDAAGQTVAANAPAQGTEQVRRRRR